MGFSPWNLDGLISCLQELNHNLQYFLATYFLGYAGITLVVALSVIGIAIMYKNQQKWRRFIGLGIIIVAMATAGITIVAAKVVIQEQLDQLAPERYEAMKLAVKTWYVDRQPIPVNQAWWLPKENADYAVYCDKTAQGLGVSNDDIYRIFRRQQLEVICERIANDLGLESEKLIGDLTDTGHQILVPPNCQLSIVKITYIRDGDQVMPLESTTKILKGPIDNKPPLLEGLSELLVPQQPELIVPLKP